MKHNDAVSWHTDIAADFDRRYSYDRKFRERYKVWTTCLDRYRTRDMNVVDMGCGSGIFSFYLAGSVRSVIGIDASTEMLKICNRKKEQTNIGNLRFIRAYVDELGDVLGDKVDMIISSSVLEYVENLDNTLDVVSRQLESNGLFIFSMPNAESIYRLLEPVVYRIFGVPKYYKYVNNVVSADTVSRKLEARGFRVLDIEYYGETPLLSGAMRGIGLSRLSDNLFVIVARRQ